MPVKIRLARRGRKKTPYYHIIVADSRAPRDGRFIEQIGSYNPMTKPATIDLDREKALDWLKKGAQPTDTAKAILRFKGVMYRRHLLRGVEKGAMTIEEADKLYQDYIETKETNVRARFEEAKKEKAEFWKAVSGSTKKTAPVYEADDEASSAFVIDQTPAVEESPAAEAPAEEAASSEETVVAEETSAAEETAPAEKTAAAEEVTPAEETAAVEESPAAEAPAEKPAEVVDSAPEQETVTSEEAAPEVTETAEAAETTEEVAPETPAEEVVSEDGTGAGEKEKP